MASSRDLSALTLDQVGWLAGLIEGEGYLAFKVPGGRGGRPSPMIRVSMCDEDVVQRLAAMWGRAYQERKCLRPAHWSAQYETEIKGKAAAEVMRLIRPHMGRRRGEKIDEILASYST